MTSLTRRHRGAVLAAVVLGVVGVLCAVLLPTFAAPGGLVPGALRSERAHDDTGLRVAGDGSLPETAPKLGAPNEPLSSAERGYAYHLARQAMPADARDILGEPGGELLTADLPALAERTPARLVTVAVYDYATDRLHQLLVDLTHHTIVRDESTQGLQLPPTQAETATALALALEAKPAPAFVAEYRKLSNTPLLVPDQVSAIAGAWRPAAARPTSPQTQVCGRHRCVQLMVALPTGQYLDTTDIVVDLSTRTVLRTELEAPSHAQ
ncbi:hypothetical protein GCM10023350_50260 [Nocardioides endophyticus]|uniref:Tat pathway signal sequence domain protein n=1 Tax=Nocardioides endophyticus TaxID=1353775 RepID=A0ABP8ZJG8_9ACTN